MAINRMALLEIQLGREKREMEKLSRDMNKDLAEMRQNLELFDEEN